MIEDSKYSDSNATEKEHYNSYVNQVARGAGISTLGQIAGRGLVYATQVVLARMYGPAQLGFYVLGTTMIWLASILSQFGVDTGIVRYVAQYRAEGDESRVRGTILLGLSATFMMSLAIASAIFLGAGFLADNVYHKPFMESVLKVFSVSLPLFTLMNMIVFALGGFQTLSGAHKYGTYVRQLIQPGANLVLIIVFYFLGARVLGAAASYVISMALGALIGLYYLRRVFPKLLESRAPAVFEPRALLTVSGPMVVANVMPYLGTWTAITALGIFSTPADVGIYNAAARTGTLSVLVLYGFSGIFSPIVSNLYKQGLLDHLGYLYKDVSRWSFASSLAVFLLTVFLGKDIMAIFGREFISGWTALLLISGAQLFSSSVGLTARVLAMTGHQRTVMLATVGSTVLGIIATVALVPTYGIFGAAVATAATIVCSNTATLLAVKRLHGLWPYDRGYTKPMIAGSIAIGAIYLLRLGLPVPPGIVTILILGPLFLIGYTALLVALGLSSSDRQLLSTLWRAVVRRVPLKSTG